MILLLISGIGLNLGLQANSALSQPTETKKETTENQGKCCPNNENHEMMGNNHQMGSNHEMMMGGNDKNHEMMMNENEKKCCNQENNNSHENHENHDNQPKN